MYCKRQVLLQNFVTSEGSFTIINNMTRTSYQFHVSISTTESPDAPLDSATRAVLVCLTCVCVCAKPKSENLNLENEAAEFTFLSEHGSLLHLWV